MLRLLKFNNRLALSPCNRPLLGWLGSSLGQIFLADKVRLSRGRLCVMGLIVSGEILKIIARPGCFGGGLSRACSYQ